MSGGSAEHVPLDLGRAEAPDPYTIQPGAILLNRFCVIGRVRHAADSWRVLVTDIERALGAPPHHRLDLHFVPADERLEGVVRLALPAHQRGTRRADAIVMVDGGICLLTAPADGPSIELPLPEDEALSVARTLAGVVAGVHRAGVAGIRFDLRELRLDAFGRPQLSTWRHLAGLRMAGPDDDVLEADTRELIDALTSLGSELVERLLRDVPLRSASVLERLSQLQPDRKLPSAADVLPAIPPFVGRDLVLLRLHEAVARARHDGPELFLVRGKDGTGKSRLLSQLAADFERGDGLFTVHVRCSRNQPTSGLAPLMEQVVDRIELMPVREREQCIARIAKSVGPLGGVLQTIGSRIAAMFGPSPPLPDIPLDERFIRHAATLAELLSAIGTQNHPLVLLLDDIQEADASIRAVLYHLLTPGRSHNTAIIVTGTPDVELPGNVIHIRLQALGEPAFASMVRAALPGPVEAHEQIARLLNEGSDGEPGTAWAILRAWVEEGAIRQDRQGRWVLEHEPTLALLPLRNVWQELGPDARRVGTLVIARAEPTTTEWIQQVTGWAPAQTNAALEPLLTGSVLVAHPDGTMFWPDDRTAEEFGANASEQELASAHRAISAWLDSPNVQSSTVLRAFHKEKAAPQDTKDEKLSILHMEAGQLHLERGDAERAEWHFARACLRTTTVARTRLALEGRADALLLLGRAEEALASYLSSMEGDSDAIRSLDLANKAVYSFHLRGKPDACATVADRALRQVNEQLPTGWREVARPVLRYGAAWALGRAYRQGDIADRLCLLFLLLMVGVGPNRPYVGLYSLVFALAASVNRVSPPAARVRAFLGAMLASMGFFGRMRALTDRAASEVAAAGSDTATEGFVLHMRGQSELSLGNYSVGMEAMEKAINAFRRAGDLSMAVFSLTLQAVYSADREPVGVLMERLNQLEAAAWRQRNDAVLPTIRGLRLWARVRSGRMTDVKAVRESVEQIIQTDIKDPYGEIFGRSLSALALAHVGEPTEALALAVQARELLERTVPRPPFLDLALVAEASALVAHVGTLHLDHARQALARVARRQNRNLSIRISHAMLKARFAIKEGKADTARVELAEVVEGLPHHGEFWHVYEAHVLLGELLAGHDAPAAQAHSSIARDLREKLQILHVNALADTTSDPAVPAVPERSPVRTIWKAIKPSLPPGVDLVVNQASQMVFDGDPALIELLVVNMVLVARDSGNQRGVIHVTSSQVTAEDEVAFTLPPSGLGMWGCIEIRADGDLTEATRGAMIECQSLCAELKGFLRVVDAESVLLRAYIPTMRPSRQASQGVAVVVHRNDRLRRGLVDGLRRGRWTVVELPPEERWPEEASIALVEGGLKLHHEPEASTTIVHVIPRGSTPPSGHYLRVPYVVGELEAVLQRVTQEPIATASQSE